MEQGSLDPMTRALVGGNATDEARWACSIPTVIQILPESSVVNVGGQSFIDRGREAVFPLIEEIVENLPRHKIIIGPGAGTRARHAYSVGLDLGIADRGVERARVLREHPERHGNLTRALNGEQVGTIITS